MLPLKFFFFLTKAQAQFAAAAGILVTLPVALTNWNTEKRVDRARRGSSQGRRRRTPAQERGGQGRPASLANMAQNRDGGNPFPDSEELDNPFQVTCAGLLWAVFPPICGVGLLFPFVTFDPGKECLYVEVTVAPGQ